MTTEAGLFRARRRRSWRPGVNLWADMAGFAALKPGRRFPTVPAAIDVMLMPGFMAVALFRFSSVLYRWKLKPLSRLAYILNMVVFGLDIWPGSRVGPGLVIPHPVGVAIAATLGARVRLYGHVQIGSAGYEDVSRDGVPVIGDGTTVFAGGKVFGPVEVGPMSIIGANTLVMKSVPAGAIVTGSPGRVVKYRDGFGDAPIRTRGERRPA